MTRIKICGLTRPEDIIAVNNALPDFIGFVFAPSKRRVTLREAERLRSALDDRIIPVGVFVNETAETIIETVKSGIIEVVQLHGNEEPGYIRALKEQTGKPIIKAVFPPFDGGEALYADYLLFDSGAGSGKCLDWGQIRQKNPFFLAGGLNADNVKTAIQMCKPYALDISSGAETNGVKDSEKINKLVRSVRND